ncbi:hypothetical protein V8C86DRAFT_2805772, partial [Haematococcus lacustris]
MTHASHTTYAMCTTSKDWLHLLAIANTHNGTAKHFALLPMPHGTKSGWAGLGWAGLGWAGLGWAGLGWAGLGWAGLGWAG